MKIYSNIAASQVRENKIKLFSWEQTKKKKKNPLNYMECFIYDFQNGVRM